MLAQKSNKKGAMEMSVGTIVTIVLLMSVLVLGIFLVQEIFSTSTNAIDQVDSQVQSEINKLFSDGDKALAILPPSKRITVQKDQQPPAGFAFSIKNPSQEQQTFNYETTVNPERCSGVSEEQLSSWVIGGSGETTLGGSQRMGSATKVVFEIPENAPECTFTASLQVEGDGNFANSRRVIVSITSGGVF